MSKEKIYTPDDVLSCSELKEMPIGTTISGGDTYYFALKTDYDEWTFDDRIEMQFSRSSRFIQSAFEYTNFIVNMP